MEQSEKFFKINKAIELARHFRNEFISRGYGFRIYSMKNVDQSQWWNYFIDAIDYYSNREEWNSYLFVRSMFDKYGKTYPHVLSRKNSWNIYLEYLPTYKNDYSLKEEVKRMVADYKKIHEIMNQKCIFAYSDFFQNAYVQELIRRSNFSDNLFIFMKSYFKNYANIYKVEETIQESYERYKIKRMKFLNNIKIKDFLKKILKDEMVGS